MKRTLATIISIAMMTGTAWAMGAAPQPAGAAPAGPMGTLMSFAPLIIIFVIFYFLLIRPQQKRAKETKLMLDALKKGDKVITSAGAYGLVEHVGTKTVTLKLGENVKIKFDRSAIAGLRADSDED